MYQQDEKVKECIQILNSADFEVVSTDFSNLDQVSQRVVILKQTDDCMRCNDQFLLQFERNGQAKLLSVIPG